MKKIILIFMIVLSFNVFAHEEKLVTFPIWREIDENNVNVLIKKENDNGWKIKTISSNDNRLFIIFYKEDKTDSYDVRKEVREACEKWEKARDR